MKKKKRIALALAAALMKHPFGVAGIGGGGR